MDKNLGHDGARHGKGRSASTYYDALDAAMVADPQGLRAGEADWHAIGRCYRATAWGVLGERLRARRAAAGRSGRLVGRALAMCVAVLLGAALHAAAAGPASPSCAATPDLHAR